jgi:hypothetical protein
MTDPMKRVDGGLDAAVCERARLARDARFDGRFFIGVLTTGVYCRPICRVRPSRPEAEAVRSETRSGRIAIRVDRERSTAAGRDQYELRYPLGVAESETPGHLATDRAADEHRVLDGTAAP